MTKLYSRNRLSTCSKPCYVGNLHEYDSKKTVVAPLVSIIGTGGTISSSWSDEGFKPDIATDKLVHLVPDLNRVADIQVREIMRKDSSNMAPKDWQAIAKEVLRDLKNPEIDGIVVTHGTDTMAYTASAVAIMIRNINKPVVFTGSQVPIGEIGTDAKRNLLDAVRVASQENIAESVIVFDSRILRGVRTIKLREYDLNAFETVDPMPIGEIARKVYVLDSSVKRRSVNDVPYWDGDLVPKVALIRVFPGIKPSLLTSLPDYGYEGIVIEGYGAGNVPIHKEDLTSAVKALYDQAVPVVITTQCVFGRTEPLLYQTGKKAFEAGAISGHDMISEVSVIKLMWALAKVKDRDIETIKALMYANLAGEINLGISD